MLLPHLLVGVSELVAHDEQRAFRVVAAVGETLATGGRGLEEGLEERVHHRSVRELLLDGGGDGGGRLEDLAPAPHPHNRHLGGGEGAGLVGADGGGAAHGLAGGEVPHQVLVLEHLLHRERQRDRHGQREALGHRDHEDGHARDQERQQLRPVHVVVPRLLAAESCLEREVHADAEHDDSKESKPRTQTRDLLGHGVELDLQHAPRVLSVRLVHLHLHRSLVRRGPDRQHQHAALPLLHECASEDGRSSHDFVAVEVVLAFLLEH
mmetsp:Transcript_17842/g.35951  ORF Transcript_17842/g.35951 Transcript_17842/m.35951 type:complete len:266 (+) Transcript_17842:1013-1810(+)